MSNNVPPELVELAKTKIQEGIRVLMDTQVKLISLGVLGGRSQSGIAAALAELVTSYMMVDREGAIQFSIQMSVEYTPKFKEALVTSEATYGPLEVEMHLRDQAEGS